MLIVFILHSQKSLKMYIPSDRSRFNFSPFQTRYCSGLNILQTLQFIDLFCINSFNRSRFYFFCRSYVYQYIQKFIKSIKQFSKVRPFLKLIFQTIQLRLIFSNMFLFIYTKTLSLFNIPGTVPLIIFSPPNPTYIYLY